MQGNVVCRTAPIDEQPHNSFGKQFRDDEYHHTAGHCRPQCQAEGRPYPVGLRGSVVVAQYRLGRLGNGVVHHEDNGEEITGYAEGSHSVFAQIADKDIVAHKHHGSNGRFTQEGRKSQPHHVTHVAHGQPQAFQTQLDALQPDHMLPLHQVDQYHQCSYNISQAGSQCCSEHAPPEDVDKQPVEEDVDQCRDDVACHGVVGRAVQSDEKHA